VIDVTVIADDLTGAADCGIAFTLAGLPAFIALAEAEAPAATRILVVDTDSRALAPAAAAERVRAAARRAHRLGTGIIYKKIDSTLRGHIGAELAALCSAAAEAGKPPVTVIAPAFPQLGRMTRGGRVLVDGIPLGDTEVWGRSGMRGPADLVPMLRHAGFEAEVAAHPGALAPLVASGARFVVCDAGHDDDLRGIAEAAAGIPGHVIWVGSAGLARHLPAALQLRPAADLFPAPAWPTGPILTLVGSRSTVSREQARRLAAESGVECFILDPACLLAGENGAGWAASAAGLERALAAGRDAVLIIRADPQIDLRHGPALAAALARLAAPHHGRLGGLVATGGDTAKAVLDAIGARGVQLVRELEPGVPIGLADLARPLPFVAKSGAFGQPSTLQHCRRALKQGRI